MRTLFMLILCMAAIQSHAQVNESSPLRIHGHVTNNRKVPIVGANIFIDGSYDGGSSDSTGYFEFNTSSGVDSITRLHITAIGHTTHSVKICLPLLQPLVIVLGRDQQVIEEVHVKAGEFRIDNQNNAALSPFDMITTAGSMGNIIGALETLPGTQVAGEDGRLMVRGGDPHETQTYVNGIRVGQPYTSSGNNLPARGRFSPMLFQGNNFSTGAYSAEFGNALSSILNLKTSPDPEEPKTDLSLSALGIAGGHTRKIANTSVSISLAHTTLGPFNKIFQQNIDWTRPYQSWSGEVAIRQKTKNSLLNIYASFASEKLGLRQEHADLGQQTETNIRAHNSYLNAGYTRYLRKNWKWELGLGLGYLDRDLSIDTLTIPTRATDLHVKSKWQKLVNSSLRYFVGVDYFYQKYQEQVSFSEHAQLALGFNNHIMAGYAELSYNLYPRWHLDVGARYTINTQALKFLEPRVAVGFRIDSQHNTSFSYGMFHQQPAEHLQKFQTNLPWQGAQHAILQYNYSSSGKLLRIELFHKSYKHLVRHDRSNTFVSPPFHTDGQGSVNGIDLFWRDNRTIPNLQYWISYSLTNARKWERDYAFAVQPPYVAKHYGSIVARYWISNWRSQVGLTNTVISGRPFHDLNQLGYVQEFTKPINTLSANWSYLITQQKIIHLAVSNVLGNQPVFGYQYAQNRNSDGVYNRIPLLPATKRFVFIGFFWTISPNKKNNQLDNL